MARIPLEYMGEQEVGAKRWGRGGGDGREQQWLQPEDL